MQGVLDSARSLTRARYGVMTPIDDEGQVQDFLSSRMTGEEAEQVWMIPERWQLFEYLGRISEPVRIPDLVDQAISNVVQSAALRFPFSTLRRSRREQSSPGS